MLSDMLECILGIVNRVTDTKCEENRVKAKETVRDLEIQRFREVENMWAEK